VRHVSPAAVELDHRVGPDRAVAEVAEPLDRPVAAGEPPRLLALLSGRRGRLDRPLAFPRQEPYARLPAVREHPRVELQLVEDVPELVHDVRAVTPAGVDDVAVPQHHMPAFAEVVGPRVGAAETHRTEALEEPGVEELLQAPLRRPDAAAVPVQLVHHWRGEELVAPDVEHDREVAGLDRHRDDRGAPGMLEDGAVVAVDCRVGRGHVLGDAHATSNRLGCRARSRRSSRALRMRSAASTRSVGSNSS
jgi:hypothetical protein